MIVLQANTASSDVVAASAHSVVCARKQKIGMVMLIGVGPHARRTHLPQLVKFGPGLGARLAGVVELVSQRDETVSVCRQHGAATEACFVEPFCGVMPEDTRWRLPAEIVSQDYHPYNQGYGKLSHSGYHCVDMVNCFLRTGMVYEANSLRRQWVTCPLDAACVHFGVDMTLVVIDNGGAASTGGQAIPAVVRFPGVNSIIEVEHQSTSESFYRTRPVGRVSWRMEGPQQPIVRAERDFRDCRPASSRR